MAPILTFLVGSSILLLLLFYIGTVRHDSKRLYGTLLIAGVVNLVAVALVAPLVARGLRRRRPDLPGEVARNYSGTALICAIAVALVAGGLAHRPAAREAERDLALQFAAVREYVVAQEPAYRDGLASADTLRISEDLYRTCVPGDDPRRPLCLVVSTDQHPAGVSRDPDRTPNARFRVHGGFD